MKPRTGDFILAAVIILAAVSIWAYPHIKESSFAQYAEIGLSGELLKTVSLKEDMEFAVGGCEVRVEGGEIYIAEADCPDRVCVNTGKISRSGQSIICVPNRLSIKIAGESGFDAVAG